MTVRMGRMFAWIAFIGATLFAAVLVAATLWAFGRAPIIHWIYDDVPRLEFPTGLVKPIEFRARILEKRNYWLNLLVYYENDVQSIAGGKIVGRYGSRDLTQSGILTEFRVVIHDDRGRIIRDENRKVVGRNGYTGKFFIRRIDEFILSPGIYFIEVTPIGDFSSFQGFRTSLDLTSYGKATPIPD